MREWLKEARTKAGMSQQETANKLQLTRQYYALIESGQRQKSLDILLAKKLGNLFNMTLDQIADYDEMMHSTAQGGEENERPVPSGKEIQSCILDNKVVPRQVHGRTASVDAD